MPYPKTAKIKENATKKAAAVVDDILHHQAFDNSLQPNILFLLNTGSILIANRAACKLLGYSKTELLTKSRADIFDVNESSFKKMLKQRKATGKFHASVTAFKKNGKPVSCAITSAVFKDKDGVKKAITTIADMSRSIREQKNIDTKKEEIVAENIALVKVKQKKIDAQKEKVVAGNIALVEAKQQKIDAKKEKIVAGNIALVEIKQKKIDAQKEKVVAGNIALVEVKQQKIDAQKEKVVAGNIALVEVKQQKIDAKKEKVVAENIALVEVKQKKIDAKKEKEVAGNILLAMSEQKEIDADKEKVVADNIILAQSKSDARLAENDEWIKHIATTSYDVMWDWDIPSGKIYVGDSINEVFGYKVKNNSVDISRFKKCLIPGEKDIFEKKLSDTLTSDSDNWDDLFGVIRYDGSIASTACRACIVRDDDGKAIRLIGAIQDISRLQELEKNLDHEIAAKEKLRLEFRESFELVFNSSSDVLFDIDLMANNMIVNNAYQKECGYKITTHMTPEDDWASHIHQDDKEVIMQEYYQVLNSNATEWEFGYRFLRADNTVADVVSSWIILRDITGKACRMIGSMQETGKKRVLKERLAHEIKLKEKQIADAREDAKEAERSVIGKELHDNVNQLLGVSKLYLDMAKQGGINTEMYMRRSSEYTLTAIEEIRKLTKSLTTDIIKDLGLSQAIDKITRDTMEVNPIKISLVMEEFMETTVSEKLKLNIFRIVQEQLNNILKHAKASKVTIELSQDRKNTRLSITDNGIGFDTSIPQKGIGIANIKARVASYKGKSYIVSQPTKGCALHVSFPITDLFTNIPSSTDKVS